MVQEWTGDPSHPKVCNHDFILRMLKRMFFVRSPQLHTNEKHFGDFLTKCVSFVVWSFLPVFWYYVFYFVTPLKSNGSHVSTVQTQSSLTDPFINSFIHSLTYSATQAHIYKHSPLKFVGLFFFLDRQ